MDQQKLVDAQFGVAAMDYLQSPTHAQGADLERLRALADGQRDWRVLDLGCGAGHASFALAGEVMEVTAYDLSAEMLVVVAAEAQRRKLANVRTQQGVAETLPFADARGDPLLGAPLGGCAACPEGSAAGAPTGGQAGGDRCYRTGNTAAGYPAAKHRSLAGCLPCARLSVL